MKRQIKRENKNNTCKICGDHIDKSSCAESWTTIIHSNFFMDDKRYKGERYTLCCSCAIDIKKLVRDKCSDSESVGVGSSKDSLSLESASAPEKVN